MNNDKLLDIIKKVFEIAPTLIGEIRTLLKKNDPTEADWEALRSRLKTYDEYITEAKRGDATGPKVP